MRYPKLLTQQSGFGLLLLVGLIAVSGLLLYPSVQFFSNETRQTQLRIDQTKAYYLAQAGVMKAAWNWYMNNDSAATTNEIARDWTPINMSGTPVVGNNFFKVGMDSNGAYLQSNFAYIVPGIAYVKEVGPPVASNVVGTPAGATLLKLVFTANSSVPVGNFVVVYFAMDANGINPNIGTLPGNGLDSKGNTYTLQADCMNAAAATVARTAIFSSPINIAPLAANDTITVNWTNNVTAKAMSVAEFSGVDTVDTKIATCLGVANGLGTANPASGNWTANLANNELVIGSIGVEGTFPGDAFTAGAGWFSGPPTRTGIGATTAGIIINPEYRIVSAAPTAYNATGTITSRDWAAAIRGFYSAKRWQSNRLGYWQVYNINATGGNNITLDKMKISWSPAGPELVNDIKLNNVSVWPGALPAQASGSTIDITNPAPLAPGAAWSGPNTYIQWSAAPNAGGAVLVTCQFIFAGDSATTDDRTHEVILWNGLQGVVGAGIVPERSFTVTSTGQVNQTLAGGFKVLKTVRAEVSGDPATAAAPAVSLVEITDWDEGDKNIP